jgi:hypothetical protein
MSYTPIEVFGRGADAGQLSWNQGISSGFGIDAWQGGVSFGDLGAYPYNSILVNINNPSIFLGMTQFSLADQQQQWSLTVLSLQDSIRSLTREMQELRDEVRQLCRMRAFVVPLTTLSPGPLQITQHIPITIEGNGEEFTATFTEANISASGETEADAIANFKDSLVSSFKLLESKNAAELGPLPTRQWGILNQVIKRAD